MTEAFRYFYHPDHLGSTSYVTDASGEVYQHLEYFAFGETFVEEHSNTDKTPYLFNGKELDEETGLYYYGARYYDGMTSVWLAVDPLAEMYSGISPYAYCANNPVNYTDPTGKEIEGVTKDDAKKAQGDINKIFAAEKFAKLRSLFTLDKKGKAFNKISAEAISGALQGVQLTDDEKSLVEIVTNTINSDKKHLVEYAQSKDNISKTGEAIMSKTLPAALVDPVKAANGGIPASIISAFGGAGVTTPTDNGTYSLIIEGLDVSQSGTDYYNSSTKTMGTNPAGRPATTGHEIFGHGRPLSLGRAGELQHTDAIQTENLILRVMGHSAIQRDGTSHASGAKVANPGALPGFR